MKNSDKPNGKNPYNRQALGFLFGAMLAGDLKKKKAEKEAKEKEAANTERIKKLEERIIELEKNNLQ